MSAIPMRALAAFLQIHTPHPAFPQIPFAPFPSHTLDYRCPMGDLIPTSICYNHRFIQYRNCINAIGKGLTLATVILIT